MNEDQARTGGINIRVVAAGLKTTAIINRP